MDEAEKHCFQKPPKVANANQCQAQTNNISVPSPSLSSQTPATPSRRIIKRIPLDYDKLKQAGLHVKLAEALSKQNASATKNIATATTTSKATSAAAAAAAGALPSATASAIYAQRQAQRERQIASMSTGNEKPLTSAEQSSQIKSLIKSRILNKSSKSQVHQQQHTATATTKSPSMEVSGTKGPPGGGGAGGGFTVPIAKADLSARSKTPFLINKVNKLPKQRAMGEIVLGQPTRQQPPPARTMAAVSARAAAPQPVRAPAAKSAAIVIPTPPLIVLENKVLAPDEKIDLRALRLPNGQPAALPPVKDMKNADKPKASTKKPTEELSQLPASGVVINATTKKMILNVNKLKVPREEIAQLAKEVRKKAMQHVQQQQQQQQQQRQRQQHNTDIPAIKTVPAQSLSSSNITRPTDVHSTSLINPQARASTNPKASSPSLMGSINVIKSIPSTKNNIRTSITPSVKASTSSTQHQSNQPSTADETSDMTASPVKSEEGELSAVDFIAQLPTDDSVDPTNYMELSAEELSMSAKFRCAKTPTSQHPICGKPEDDLPIGKILQMEEMDILHATLNVNVNGNKSNVLCISPNAIKLQNSARSEDIECHQPVDDNDEIYASAATSTPLKLVTPKHVYTNVNRKNILSRPPTLVVTPPTKDEVPEKQVVAAHKPHVEQMCDKEESQSAKPLSYRPKRGKVNLVQRNKRAGVSKPNEIIVEKVTEEPVRVSDTEISSDFNEASKDPAPKQEDNKEQPKRVNDSKPNEIIAKQVTEEADFDKDTTLKQADNQKQAKRAGVSNPNKIIAEKVTEEPVYMSDTEIPTDLMEAMKETVLGKDPTSTQTENKEQTKGATISQPNEIIDKQIKEETDRVSDKEMLADLTEAMKKTALHKYTASKRADTTEQELCQQTENIKSAEESERNELDTAKADREKIESVVKATTDKIVISNDIEHVIREETADGGKSVSNPVQRNLSKERDLTQLYHPPKLSKNKQRILNKEHPSATAPSTTVSLLDVLTQEPPPPQGEPQLPFRSGEPDAKKLKTMDSNFAEALGIQNLLNHLPAEDAVPHNSKEVQSEETAKTPRKKLLKTRPVLNAKRSTKEPQARKRPLPAEGNANGNQRMATSSTSDDNGDSFHGFDDATSSGKHDKHSKDRETDISDDATPDYDETEEEHQSDIRVLAKKAKHETAVQTIKKIKTITKLVEDNAGNPENDAPLNPAPKQSLKEKSSTENPPVQKQELEKKRKRPLQIGGKAKEKSKPIMESSAQANINSSTEIAEIGEVLNSVEPEKTVNEEPVIVKKKRGRPRKIAVMSDAAHPMDTSADLATPKANFDSSSLPPDATSTPTPKRRGRKPKPINLLTNTAKNVTTNEEDADTSQQDNEFYTRLLLIRKREQLESGEELREEGRGEGDQQCGLCLVRCDTADWQLHLEEHYGVGWLIAEPAPLLTRSVVLKLMKSYADGGNKSFNCRLCNRSLISALGMLTHLEGCGYKQRIECEYCKNSYTKLSYQAHYRRCTKREGQPGEEEQLAKSAANQPVYSNAGRAKRKSTLQAETKLGKIAEHITTQDDKEFDGDASDYDVGTDKESSDSDESEGVDSNEEDQESKSTIKKVAKILYGRMNDKNIVQDRWKYFAHVNYSKSVLYPHLLPRYEQMLTADAKRLLPSRESISMRYAYNKVDDNDWTQLAPLQGFNTGYEYMCYLGNAIKELAWVPLPPKVEAQYLLCSQRNKVLGFTRQFQVRHEDELLLLLECKVSPGSDDNVWPMQTRLHYGICVPQQPVHSFAFMPSGGYDESINRLALLAVGSSSGAVIYALPLRLTENERTKSDENQPDTVIVLQPMLTLTLDIDNPVQDPCTKICWSEASGHNLLVSGYASGNVAFYDIGDEEGLNCIDRNNHRYFLPAHFFYFGERNIYYLELHYDTNGARWLAVATTMRKLCVYDIANWSLPLPIVCDPIVNLYLGGAYWPPVWESLAVGSTEVYKSQYPRLVTLNPTGICFSHASMDLLLSSPRAVHFNWEQMTLVMVTDGGDVVFIKCQQFNFETLVQKRTKTYRTVSLTEARYLSGNTVPNSISPDEFKQDFGLLINPLQNVTNNNKSTYLNLKRRPNFYLSNLLRLNCVRWNWNVGARNWLAVGAEHGLLRIIKYNPEKDFCCI